MAKKAAPTSVLVTTSHRGVFWGYIEKTTPDGKTVTLNGARNAIYWATTKGFLELASVGPNSKSRVGARADSIVLHDVTSVTKCSEAAAKTWESFA